MVLTSNDISHVLVWLVWEYYSFAFKSPWGLWSPQTRDKFRSKRRQTKYIGPTESVYGTVWLITPLLLSAGSFIFFREFETVALQWIYITNFILIVATSVFNKLWRPLFFDYNLYLAAAWMKGLALLCNIICCAMVGISNAWVPLGLYTLHALWLTYMIYVSVSWYDIFIKNNIRINKY